MPSMIDERTVCHRPWSSSVGPYFSHPPDSLWAFVCFMRSALFATLGLNDPSFSLGKIIAVGGISRGKGGSEYGPAC
jgi:hypothetical protein